MFLVPPLSSLSLCLSAGLAFTPASCPADPLSLSRCPSFRYSPSPLASTGLASVTRSHQSSPPPVPLGHFRLLVPASRGFFLCASHRWVAPAMGVTHPSQGQDTAGGGNYSISLGHQGEGELWTLVPRSWVSCTFKPCALNRLVLPGCSQSTVLPTSGGQSEITSFSIRLN